MRLMRWLLITLVLIACGRKIDLKKEQTRYDEYITALPELKPVSTDKPVTLNVLVLDNPDLPGLDANEITQLYSDIAKLAKQVYGYDLRISHMTRRNIRSFFSDARSRFDYFPIAFPAHGFPISYFAPDRDIRIAEVFAAIYKKKDKQRLNEYLGEISTPEAGTKQFLAKLTGALAGPDLKGRPLLAEANRDDEVFYSFGHWSTILQGEREADFILTNSGIIGADNGMPLYVVARGGVTNAFVENNAYRPYQGAGVLGMYPFLAETPYFNEQRGRLSQTEKIEAIAWLWLHELGHLLLKKEENYTFADSVHRAPATLRYMDWVKAIRNTKNHHTSEIGNMKKF